MKKKLVFIFSLLSIPFLQAQDIPKPATDETIYKTEEVDTPPDFQGGIDAFYNAFQKKFKAPAVPGLVDKVVLSFVVETDGTLTDMRVVHDAGFGTAAQCRQILETFPKWIPGTKDKKRVRTTYLLPIAVITE